VAVPPDAPDLGQVRVALQQRVVVLERLPLLGRLDAAALRRAGAPQPDVALGKQKSVSGKGQKKKVREPCGRRRRTSSLPLRMYLESMVQSVRNTLCIRLVW
jgi:hypothetical protein